MEPMDTDEASDGVAFDPKVVCAPVEGAALTEDLVLTDADCWPENSVAIDTENVDAQISDARVTNLEAISEPSVEQPVDQEEEEEEEVGAAAECLSGLPELLQPKALSEKALNKFTGAEKGPVMSGDGAVLEQLSLRVLKSISAAIKALNLVTNADVHACCGLLDDQEARAFLAADLLGIELVRGSRANESRKVGEQIDTLLRGEKARDKLIRKGIRSRKSKARGKPGAESKLPALDVEQRRKRAEHWDAAVALELPDTSVTKVEKERERPLPPPPPTPPPSTAPPTAAAIAKLDEAVALADCDVVAARRRLERSEAAMQECLAQRLEAAKVGHNHDDDAYADLLTVRAELATEWEQHRALGLELRREQADAEDRLAEARDAAKEARDDVAMATRSAELEAEWRARQAAIDERFRLERHRRLMEFYDTMTPDELRDYLQAKGRARQAQGDKESPPPLLAPGPPRTYDLRGDPSDWQLPSPPPPPPSPPQPWPPSGPPSEPPPSPEPPGGRGQCS
jgi:hypothetical protein